jgi:hypothetical protein
VVVETQHTALTGAECRPGNVLAGASNAEDLRVLSECQDATGTVMHTKKMDDGDYKFFLNLDEQFRFLVNEKNNEKPDGFLVAEIVPPDQGIQGVYLPKDGDHVHVWGAWVTDNQKDDMKFTLLGKLLISNNTLQILLQADYAPIHNSSYCRQTKVHGLIRIDYVPHKPHL